MNTHLRSNRLEGGRVWIDVRCLSYGFAVYLINHLLQCLVICNLCWHWCLCLLFLTFRLRWSFPGILTIFDIERLYDFLPLEFRLIHICKIQVRLLLLLFSRLSWCLLSREVDVTLSLWVLNWRRLIVFFIKTFPISLFVRDIWISIGILVFIWIHFNIWLYRSHGFIGIFSLLLEMMDSWFALWIDSLIEYNRLRCWWLLFLSI